MMPAGIAPAAAAAVAMRRVLRPFREGQAFSPDRAIGFEPQRRLERRYFNSLRDFGAVVATGRGTFYLDEAKLAEHVARRRRRALGMIGLVVAVLLAAGLAAFGVSRP